MLNAAPAHGRPMMVMAMITAATSQARAIQTPPSSSQRTFSKIETGGMRLSSTEATRARNSATYRRFRRAGIVDEVQIERRRRVRPRYSLADPSSNLPAMAPRSFDWRDRSPRGHPLGWRRILRYATATPVSSRGPKYFLTSDAGFGALNR